ncbi:MAG TPA: AlkA N-terminal domain-containing protein [Jiangellaceae bacterium]
MLDFDVCRRAAESRDARFDGIFFTGVHTTGIYCRPSCPAITPKRENVAFYRSAAEAQAAGLRACRRCRPDVAPGSPEWNIRADLAGRAMRLIIDGVVDREGVAGLAGRLGYTERHVHRTLLAEVGASPIALARAQRAHTSRILLETTELPITEVAFAAGFASIRQFNDTIRVAFDRTPRELRARAHTKGPPAPGVIELRLAYRRPADIAGVFQFLGTRAVPGVEEMDGGTYRRSLALPNGTGVAELTPADGYVQATLHLADLRDLSAAVARCRRLFDLDSDSAGIDEALRDGPLAPHVAAQPGMRVPGAVSGDELAVRAVLGQQISVVAARNLAGRLTAEFGKPLDEPVGGVTHTFPSAAVLAAVDPSEFPMPRARQRALHELTTRLAEGAVRLDPGADRDDTRRGLLDVPGIGPWTADYIRMRVLGDPDVFLASDLGVRKGMERLGLPADPRHATEYAERWRPWRSYAQLHLWALLNQPNPDRSIS